MSRQGWRRLTWLEIRGVTANLPTASWHRKTGAMMTCQELLDFLMSYLDDELPTGQRAEFDRHLGVCPACVAYLDSYRRTIALAGRLAAHESAVAAEVPEPLISAILAARRSP